MEWGLANGVRGRVSVAKWKGVCGINNMVGRESW